MPYVIFLAAPGMEQLKSLYEAASSRYSSRNLAGGTVLIKQTVACFDGVLLIDVVFVLFVFLFRSNSLNGLARFGSVQEEPARLNLSCPFTRLHLFHIFYSLISLL